MPVQTSLVSSSKQSGCLGSTSVRHYLISILISMCYELFEGGDLQCLGTRGHMDWEVHFRTWGADYMGFYPPSGHTSRAGASTLGAGKGGRPAIWRPTRQVWGVSVAFPPPDIALLPPLTVVVPSSNHQSRISGISGNTMARFAPPPHHCRTAWVPIPPRRGNR